MYTIDILLTYLIYISFLTNEIPGIQHDYVVMLYISFIKNKINQIGHIANIIIIFRW